MRPRKTFGIHFWIKTSKKRNDGKIPIYGRISVDGIRKDFSVRRSIREQDWCSRSGRAIPRTAIAKTLNPYLDKVAVEVRECFEGFMRNHELVSAQLLKMRYLGLEKENNSLLSLIKFHNQVELRKLAPGTAKNYSATETYLKRYLKDKYKTEDVNLTQVDYAFILQFEDYLRTCRPLRSSQPLTNNGIMKHLERFQKIMGLALKFDWIAQNPFKRYQLKFKEYDAAYLEAGELRGLERLVPNNKRLALSLDVFVFACFTGLGYIEVKQLKQMNIVKGIDGDEWINITRQKTSVPVKVPLLKRAKEILDKYKTYPQSNSQGLLLPTPSNVTLNRDIKVLGKKVGITKHLTFHVARHTFATTITLTNGVPVETVSKLLGHTKLSTTKRYARVIEQKISHDMNNLKRVLELKKSISEQGLITSQDCDSKSIKGIEMKRSTLRVIR